MKTIVFHVCMLTLFCVSVSVGSVAHEMLQGIKVIVKALS